MPDINSLKQELRRRYKAVRKAIDVMDKSESDKDIFRRVVCSEEYRNASLLLTYCSRDGETDTLSIIGKALDDGRKVACPRCRTEDHAMTFHRISSLDELSEGAYGIHEPPPDAPVVQPEEMAESICIVPGLSFDASGGRLGYGGGYYDRFLAGYTGVAVGICMAECFSDKPLPQDSNDVRVSVVITDRYSVRS